MLLTQAHLCNNVNMPCTIKTQIGQFTFSAFHILPNIRFYSFRFRILLSAIPHFTNTQCLHTYLTDVGPSHIYVYAIIIK